MSDAARALARLIDHTYLTQGDQTTDRLAVMQLCDEAMQHQFVAVCVRPDWVRFARQQLIDSNVRVATVIGFPAGELNYAAECETPTIGNTPLVEKIEEARQAIAGGVQELDWVLDVWAFQDNRYASETEILHAVSVAAGLPVKLIIETDILSDDEIAWLVPRALQWGAAMVKTSTGMLNGGEGGSVRRIQQLTECIRRNGFCAARPWPLKASGGIRTAAHAKALLNLGIRRIGTSAGVAMMSSV